MNLKKTNTKKIPSSSNGGTLEEQLIKTKEAAEAANLALRKERDLLQRYLSLVEAIIVTIDPNGTITMLNRKGCELLGYREEEILGENWFKKCLPQPEVGDVYSLFKEVMNGNLAAMEYFENEIFTKDGQKRLIAWHNNYFRDANGQIVGTISAGEDITKRKQAEKEREKLISKLQKALNEIKTLRGILPICSYCKNIRNDKGYYEQIEEYIHKHSGVDFSHTICPTCLKEHYPENYTSFYSDKNKE